MSGCRETLLTSDVRGTNKNRRPLFCWCTLPQPEHNPFWRREIRAWRWPLEAENGRYFLREWLALASPIDLITRSSALSGPPWHDAKIRLLLGWTIDEFGFSSAIWRINRRRNPMLYWIPKACQARFFAGDYESASDAPQF